MSHAFTFTVDANILRAALAFAGKDWAVHVLADGRIAATDNHTMVVFYPHPMIEIAMRTRDVKLELNISADALGRFMANQTIQGNLDFVGQDSPGGPTLRASYEVAPRIGGTVPAQIISSGLAMYQGGNAGKMTAVVDESLAGCPKTLGPFCVDPTYLRRLETVSNALGRWDAYPWLRGGAARAPTRWDFHDSDARAMLATVVIMPVAHHFPEPK